MGLAGGKGILCLFPSRGRKTLERNGEWSVSTRQSLSSLFLHRSTERSGRILYLARRRFFLGCCRLLHALPPVGHFILARQHVSDVKCLEATQAQRKIASERYQVVLYGIAGFAAKTYNLPIMEPMPMFSDEEQLMAAFDTALQGSELWLSFPGKLTFMMEEVEGLHGRVDRMMVSLPSAVRPTKAKSELLQQPTSCRIIIALHAKQPKSIEQLALDTGRCPETIRFWLARMEQEGMVRALRGRGYVLGPRSQLPACEIWCFEGKLRDWPRAIYQATRYRAFAHRSLVVMPEDCVRPAEAQLERFRLARVGLLALSTEGRLRIIAMPRSKTPRSQVMHAMAKGRALARIA